MLEFSSVTASLSISFVCPLLIWQLLGVPEVGLVCSSLLLLMLMLGKPLFVRGWDNRSIFYQWSSCVGQRRFLSNDKEKSWIKMKIEDYLGLTSERLYCRWKSERHGDAYPICRKYELTEIDQWNSFSKLRHCRKVRNSSTHMFIPCAHDDNLLHPSVPGKCLFRELEDFSIPIRGFACAQIKITSQCCSYS